MTKQISFEDHKKVGLALREMRALLFSILKHMASGLPRSSKEYRVFMRMLKYNDSLRNFLEERMFWDHAEEVNRMPDAEKFSVYYGKMTPEEKDGGSHVC